MNIYVEDNSKNMKDESFQKNYRNDVYVKIDNNFYNLSIITIARLKEEVEESFENEIVFCMPNNLIIVKEVTNDCIIDSIKVLYHKNYFSGCKECEINDNKIIYNLSEEVKKVYKKNNFDISFPINKLEQIF
ncbi:MAG: hypothetical protein V8R15_08175 [Bacilli bacterium]|jgi:hypothetical protein